MAACGNDLVEWLEEREEAGIVHTSLSGCGEASDRWSGCADDFDCQTGILRNRNGTLRYTAVQDCGGTVSSADS